MDHDQYHLPKSSSDEAFDGSIGQGLPLERRLLRGASAQEVATNLDNIFNKISCALSPIVGVRGLAALHGRCLHLAVIRNPLIAIFRSENTQLSDLDVLLGLIAQSDVVESVLISHIYLQSFYDLVESLIGLSLTATLLKEIWTPIPISQPSQSDQSKSSHHQNDVSPPPQNDS